MRELFRNSKDFGNDFLTASINLITAVKSDLQSVVEQVSNNNKI